MIRAAGRRSWLAWLLPVAAASALFAQAPSRSTPSRPVAGKPSASASAARDIATRKFGKLDYVKATDVAARLGLKATKYDRGRRVVLAGGSTRAELEADTRDITVNGVRVFLGDKTEDLGGEIYLSRVDYERCLAPLVKPGAGPVGKPLPAGRVVVLDPGHGGKDNGTSKYEKVYALDVAARARKLLEAAGFRVVMTRTEDVYLTLAQRPAIAQASKADLFVSIHFNALERDTKTSGVEVYTFPPQNQRGTNAWSPGERNNAEDDDSPVNRYDYWSSALAHAIHRRFVRDLKTFDRGKKLMHLGVLRSLKCPGVLLECGFLTSQTEARKIATAAYRDKLARTLVAGIRDYAATLESVRKKT